MKYRILVKRITTVVISLVLLFQVTACGLKSGISDKASQAASGLNDLSNKASQAIAGAKEALEKWYESIDLSCFKKGWDTAVSYMGSAYSAIVTGEYVNEVGIAINSLKANVNMAYDSARGIAQEAGFVAEKWHAGTFNIDAAVKQSDYRAETPGSTDLGSVDVKTNYGEEASLKYYQKADASAQAQAASYLDAYKKYCAQAMKKGKTPKSLPEYMDEKGYNYKTEDELMASIYKGQTRIIPEDQLAEATKYLKGKSQKPPTINASPEKIQTYQETLNNLRDRLQAPDGTQSKPASYEEMQAITELAKEGKFDPEDFGISLSQVITPKYVVAQAVGTGVTSGLLRTVFTVGPDLVSIVVEAVKNEGIDENALKDLGVDSAIAMSEGFVEGALSSVIVNLCKQGVFGSALKAAPSNVVGSLVFLTIEALISGYALAKGEITAEEYGWLIADRTLITALAIPTTALMLAVLPGTKLCVLIGCLAGGMIAATGYTIAKEQTIEFIDGGGFEAIIPTTVSSKISSAIKSAKDIVSKMNLSEQFSNLKDFVVTTADNGLIQIKAAVGK